MRTPEDVPSVLPSELVRTPVREVLEVTIEKGPRRTSKGINPRVEIDEERLSEMYRTGTLSNRAIAVKLQISEVFVRKVAKRLGLTKDLAPRVRAQVQDNLVRAAVRSGDTARTDREIVVDAAEQGTSAVLGHRHSLFKLRKTADVLSEQLAFAVTNREELQALLKTTTEPAARIATLLKVLSLPTQAGIAKDLAAVYQSVIRVERQALGLNDEAPSETPFEELLRQINAEAG